MIYKNITKKTAYAVQQGTRRPIKPGGTISLSQSDINHSPGALKSFELVPNKPPRQIKNKVEFEDQIVLQTEKKKGQKPAPKKPPTPVEEKTVPGNVPTDENGQVVETEEVATTVKGPGIVENVQADEPKTKEPEKKDEKPPEEPEKGDIKETKGTDKKEPEKKEEAKKENKPNKDDKKSG